MLERHPRLRVWSAHGGGYLPSYVVRADHAWAARSDARTTTEPPSALLRRTFVDSLVYTPEQLRHRLRTLSTKELVSVAARFRLGEGPRDVTTATK